METSTMLVSHKRKRPSPSSFTPLFSFFTKASHGSDPEFADDDDPSRLTVKVLSTRRVFSPDPENEELHRSIPNASSHGQTKKQSESMSVNKGNCGIYSAVRGRMLKPEDESIDESVQTTPPEAVESIGSGDSRIGDRNLVEPVQTTAKHRQGPNRRFRGRLVKPPGSFSYRRLLPYLMDIAKEDDSCITETCQGHKSEKDVEDNPQQRAQDFGSRDIPMNDSKDLSVKSTAEPVVLSGLAYQSSPIDPLNNLSPCSVMDGIDQSSDRQGPNLMEKGETEGSSTSCKADSVSVFSSLAKDGSINPCLTDEKPSDNKVMEEFQVCHTPGCDNEENGKRCHLEKVNQRTEVLSQVDCSSANRWQPVFQNADSVREKSSTGSINEVSCNLLDESKKSPLKRRNTLNPCSRSKLFKSPNSFSYRRLLPYLMEITKDDSGNQRNSDSPKFHTPNEGKLHSPPHCSGSKEPASKTSDGHPNLFEHDHNVSSVSTTTSTSLKNNQVVDLEIFASSADVKSQASPENEKVINELDSTSPVKEVIVASEAEPAKADRENQESPKNGASNHFEDPCVVSRRGVLKRNPRGCRGLCTCLYCTSFRLNAERAFEFSRNQMKDAEEVALNLMKELSHLKNVVEKFNTGDMPNAQVKEACLRASEADEVAKDRLALMNEDLNIHCRVKSLHRPSVAFNEH